MTKMAATPLYGKNPSKIFFSGTGGPISTKFYDFYNVKFGNLGFYVKTVDFSEIIAPSDLKGSRSRHLIEYMKICEY